MISNLYLKDGQLAYISIKLADLTLPNEFEWIWLRGLISINKSFLWYSKVDDMRLGEVAFLQGNWIIDCSKCLGVNGFFEPLNKREWCSIYREILLGFVTWMSSWAVDLIANLTFDLVAI